MLLLIAFVDVAVANGSPDNNEAAVSRGSSRAEKRVALDRLPYQNLRDSSKWSRLIHGHALTLSLRKKHAHGLQEPDYCLDCDLLFSEYGSGDMIGPLLEVDANNRGGGGGCDWKCCFKTCMNSAMGPADNFCLVNCTACGTTGAAWPCAICASCGVVGFASIEFCGLHCCVNPGCPAR
jgi:hypothetical protein